MGRFFSRILGRRVDVPGVDFCLNLIKSGKTIDFMTLY